MNVAETPKQQDAPESLLESSREYSIREIYEKFLVDLQNIGVVGGWSIFKNNFQKLNLQSHILSRKKSRLKNNLLEQRYITFSIETEL